MRQGEVLKRWFAIVAVISALVGASAACDNPRRQSPTTTPEPQGEQIERMLEELATMNATADPLDDLP